MKRFQIITFILVLISFNGFSQVSLQNLKVEYEETPLGIDIKKPRFSWQMNVADELRGYYQTAYSLTVKDEWGNEVWNTGAVKSNESLNILYDGQDLQAATKYNWEVNVIDQKGESHQASSWFETGLMNSNPNLQAWDGADWIGGTSEDLVLYSQALSVYKVFYKIKLDSESESSKAAFVFGANDFRLMDKNKNILGVEVGKDESYFSFELDISEVDETEEGLAKLNIYRVGYSPNDAANKALYSFDISKSLINEQNKYDWHEVYFEMNFGKCMIYLDGKAEANNINPDKNAPPWLDVKGSNLNPHGDQGGDQIAYPMLGDIGFKLEKNQKAYFSELAVMNFRAPSNDLFNENLEGESYNGIFQSDDLSVKDDSYVVGNADKDVLIIANPDKNSMPMLRTTFSSEEKEIAKARLYVTARGIYEMYINGERIGDDYFNPGLTQYNKTHMYQTYDITDQIKKGKNAVGAMLGEGWWSGNLSYRGYNWNYFGDRQSLLAKMVITYADGSTQTVVTEPKTWKYFNNSPIIYGSYFQGEVYDARKEALIAGWSSSDYDDSNWKSVVKIPLEGTAYIKESNDESAFNYDDLQIIGQLGNNAKIVKTLTAQSVEEVRPGVFVYDMGQNMVGFPQIKISGKSGDMVSLRYAEMKYPNLPEHKNYVGMIMMENIRAALTTDKWILKGGEETIKPTFTFHGFRYIEITGIKKAIPKEDVKGLVVSSIENLASSYETSNQQVNRLWKNITWSFRGNFLSIPTDTPARNERMGWNGDINVFAKTATYLGNVDQFLRRHLLANRELQSKNGRFPDIAPVGTGFGGTLWGSAGVTIPWEVYQQYGDLKILEENYDAMKAYVDFLESRQNAEGILDEGPLGDWLSPEGYKNDNSMIWTAYQIYDLMILTESAKLLGKNEDAKKYAEKHQQRKDFFNKTYVDPTTHKTIHSGYSGMSLAAKPEDYSFEKGGFVDSQASYAIPLALGAFKDEYETDIAKHLAETVKRKNVDHMGKSRPEYSLMTGFIGTATMAPALSEFGYDQAAYSLLQQDSYPSWLYSVKNGATTIWERLNSYTVEDGFGGNNGMNSFNHYSFGAIGSWMYNYSLGIQRAEPGFKSFILQPTPDPTGEMNWTKGYYDSMYGRIESEWKIEGIQLNYKTTVPANATATLYLPATSQKVVKESSKKASKVNGIEFVKFENGKAVYKLSAGKYEFTSEINY